jgi:hypothetical protein
MLPLTTKIIVSATSNSKPTPYYSTPPLDSHGFLFDKKLKTTEETLDKEASHLSTYQAKI